MKHMVVRMKQYEWYSISDAMEKLQYSRTTLYRKMDSGDLVSKKIGGSRLVGIEIDDTDNETNSTLNETNDTDVLQTELVDNLKEQIIYLKLQIENLQEEQRRNQTIIMSLSQNQKLLMDAKKSWWQKLLGISNTIEGTI